MRKLTLTLIGIAGIVAAACGGGGAAQMPSVRVTLSDFKFAPAPIQVPANTKVAFQLTNSGSVEHDVTAKDLGMHLYVGTAKRVEEVVGPFKPGTYDIYCGIAGHREAGMVGKIVVK